MIVVCMNCEISSINKAIEISKPYDTIIVKSGVYYEKIEIKKPLILIGENYPKIGGKDENEIIKVLSDNVKIIGFEFLNSGYSEIY
ncbi:MAG: nitrous oxide reductase family maturation protein NosD, partial [candidate division WOR-3 bacterium]